MDLNRIAGVAYGNALARLYGLDDLNAVSNVAPEIMPTTSIWERPEFWALLNGSLCSTVIQVTALAANFSYVFLFNPASSGVLAIVEDVSVDNALASPAVWGVTAGDPGFASSTKTHRDLRRGSLLLQSTGIALITEQAQQPVSTLITASGLAPGTATHPVDVVLPPGFTWGIRTWAVNTELRVGVRWRERPISTMEAGRL